MYLDRQMNHSVPNTHVISSTHNCTMPTHTHHKVTCCTLNSPTCSKLFHTQHTMCHRLKINDVTLIKQKYE
jgi:hypothetical protein